MKFGLDYAFTRRDNLRQGANTLVDTLQQKTETHLVSASTQFGITNKYSIAASIPFIINRSKNKFLDSTETNFGDLSLAIRSFYSPTIFSKPSNLQLSLGATFPVGGGITNVVTDERNFASGSVDLLASAVFALGFKPNWNVTGKFFTRQVFVESSSGQKTGNYYENSCELSYAPLLRGYSMYLGFAALYRGRDETDGAPFPNSGGNWIFLKLGGSGIILGRGESSVKLWGEFQFPVHQYVNGLQLTEKWNLRFGFSTGFSLFGHGHNNKGTTLFDMQ